MKKKLLLLIFLTAFKLSYSQVTVNIPGPVTFNGFTFNELYSTNELQGTLTSVQINATLTASVSETYANDLTLYVTPTATLAANGLLQIGGFSDTGATELQSWPCGAACDSDAPGTVVSGTVTLDTPLNFTGSTYSVWLGNGYSGAGTSGTWANITLTLTGVTEVTTATTDFISSKFSVYPNPVNSIINIANTNNIDITKTFVTDINGRTVKTVSGNVSQINVSDLNAGVYFMNIETNEGTAVKKIVKN
ncbi:T9SS type A sorting domain-containing protein [Flavobacterium suncheonense]|nr:T9SS type A sorting domain-containing protein [Flavobacterium suncheonense]